ncbi:uncharacterized protein LOC130767803 isoform X2 [Actinidia eriantha]|uniref:uncharacterized protein LOC130767803 isoform X2 n=1 Tax=Actinidia eriantha TaxID=165200 RepID=UPI0025894E60|nr:uncharacterized protein LOC130767803 isoform X2 [Actinidia eriantha]
MVATVRAGTLYWRPGAPLLSGYVSDMWKVKCSDVADGKLCLQALLRKFTIALREIGTYKEILRSQTSRAEIWNLFPFLQHFLLPSNPMC